LGSAGDRFPVAAVLTEDARMEERLHQAHDTLVPDPFPQPTDDADMRDLVEARLDIALQHPLVGAGSQKVNLGDGVLGSALGAEAVATRLEVRLEDRLEHQLQGRLDHPVAGGGDPQHPDLAVRFGDQPLAYGHGLKGPGFELSSQPGQQHIAEDDGVGFDSVHSS
jgi:hypothetical protein